VIRAEPDVAIILFGEEDFGDSILIGERRFGPGPDAVAGIPAATQDRRPAGRPVDGSLRPLTARHWPVDLVLPPSTARAQSAPGTFVGDYDALVAELLTRLTPAQIYLVTPPYRPDAEIPNAVRLTLADYAGAVRDIAIDREVRLLDAYSQSTIQPSTYARLSVDGRTLNEDGHQHLAAFVIDAMLGYK
jgi:hypothetical protein